LKKKGGLQLICFFIEMVIFLANQIVHQSINQLRCLRTLLVDGLPCELEGGHGELQEELYGELLP
jgi:hypothetical protein